MLTAPETSALNAAFEKAKTTLVGYDPNPRVGCAILATDGSLVAVAGHAGAGTAHAEVAALAQAGAAAEGATALVTLQPCTYRGRTGPCTEAIIASGVAKVVYAIADPSGHADDSDAALRAAGIEVVPDADTGRGLDLLGTWGFAQSIKRPHVTWKVATSLDGRVADATGTSKWITGDTAREQVQTYRSRVGAIITGTGTVLADDPHLTVRGEPANHITAPALRVVVGERDVPLWAKIRGSDGAFLHVQTRDISSVLAELFGRGIHAALLECGPGLAGAMVANDAVDEVLWFTAGVLLGEGQPAVAGQWALPDARRWEPVSAAIIGADVLTHWRAPRADQKWS